MTGQDLRTLCAAAEAEVARLRALLAEVKASRDETRADRDQLRADRDGLREWAERLLGPRRLARGGGVLSADSVVLLQTVCVLGSSLECVLEQILR